MQYRTQRFLALGDRVSVDCGFFWHVGIVSGYSIYGQPLVISASKRRGIVVEESLDEFSGGGPVRHEGFKRDLPRRVVVAQMRTMIGQPWHLFRNCEHVASAAEGRQPTSPQLAGWFFAGLLVFAATRRSA